MCEPRRIIRQECIKHRTDYAHERSGLFRYSDRAADPVNETIVRKIVELTKFSGEAVRIDTMGSANFG